MRSARIHGSHDGEAKDLRGLSTEFTRPTGHRRPSPTTTRTTGQRRPELELRRDAPDPRVKPRRRWPLPQAERPVDPLHGSTASNEYPSPGHERIAGALRAVFLDIGDTVMRPNPSWEHVYAIAFAESGHRGRHRRACDAALRAAYHHGGWGMDGGFEPSEETSFRRTVGHRPGGDRGARAGADAARPSFGASRALHGHQPLARLPRRVRGAARISRARPHRGRREQLGLEPARAAPRAGPRAPLRLHRGQRAGRLREAASAASSSTRWSRRAWRRTRPSTSATTSTPTSRVRPRVGIGAVLIDRQDRFHPETTCPTACRYHVARRELLPIVDATAGRRMTRPLALLRRHPDRRGVARAPCATPSEGWRSDDGRGPALDRSRRWHVTLAFLGDDRCRGGPEHCRRAAQAWPRHQPTASRSGRVASVALPRPDARVGWYGVGPPEAGIASSHDRRRAARWASTQRRRFRPHVTLARARRRARRPAVWLAVASAAALAAAVADRQLDAVAQPPRRGPARYETLARSPLGSARR